MPIRASEQECLWLDVGTNDLEMAHYCPLYRDGWCESFHDEEPDSTCDSGNVKSVRFTV